MDRWIAPIPLQGKLITLAPLNASHQQGLIEAATDGALWNLWFTHIPKPEQTEAYIANALQQGQQGTACAFTVIDNLSGRILGSTRFCNIDATNRRAEIGYTWYRQSVQRTGVNSECKLLLLSHAFETLNAIAVEFRTHWHNHKSRTAIARLGAKQDGILRQHQIMPDGSYRDTVVFSILNNEWPTVKNALLRSMQRYAQGDKSHG